MKVKLKLLMTHESEKKLLHSVDCLGLSLVGLLLNGGSSPGLVQGLALPAVVLILARDRDIHAPFLSLCFIQKER